MGAGQIDTEEENRHEATLGGKKGYLSKDKWEGAVGTICEKLDDKL